MLICEKPEGENFLTVYAKTFFSPPGDLSDNNISLTKKLGSGAFGDVFRASMKTSISDRRKQVFQGVMEQDVAVKFLQQTSTDALQVVKEELSLLGVIKVQLS